MLCRFMRNAIGLTTDYHASKYRKQISAKAVFSITVAGIINWDEKDSRAEPLYIFFVIGESLQVLIRSSVQLNESGIGRKAVVEGMLGRKGPVVSLLQTLEFWNSVISSFLSVLVRRPCCYQWNQILKISRDHCQNCHQNPCCLMY